MSKSLARRKSAKRRRPKGLGSVYEHGARWWTAYRDERGNRVRIPGGFDGKGAITKTEAEEHLRVILADREMGVSVAAALQRKTISEYLDDDLADLETRRKQSLADATLRPCGPASGTFDRWI